VGLSQNYMDTEIVYSMIIDIQTIYPHQLQVTESPLIQVTIRLIR